MAGVRPAESVVMILTMSPDFASVLRKLFGAKRDPLVQIDFT